MSKIRLRDKDIEVVFNESNHGLEERIKIHQNQKFNLILSNLEKKGVFNFIKKKKYTSFPLKMIKKEEKKAIFQHSNEDVSINMRVEIMTPNLLHYQYQIHPKQNYKLSSVRVLYQIPSNMSHEVLWTPHLTPEKDYVIADHVFRSPVLLYKSDNLILAFIPDLKLMQNHYWGKTLMDIDLNKETIISYGFGKYSPKKHVFFNHSSKKSLNITSNEKLEFGYYIKILKDSSFTETVKYVNKLLWDFYGSELLKESFKPQILSFETHVKEGFDAIFKRHNYWGHFSINNNECGGIWQRTWMGDKKKELTFISPKDLEKHKKTRLKEIAGTDSFLGKIINKLSSSPRYIKFFDKFTRHHSIVRRVAEIWNNAWFLNIRTAYGLRFFGDHWQNQDLKEKGNKILSTLLSLPRKQGLFPSVILPGSENAHKFSFINGVKAFRYTNEYHIVDAALAMYWALKFYQDFERNELIIKYSNDLKSLIHKIQLENGAIPTFVRFDENEELTISKELIDSASSGASLMFLTELFKIKRDSSILNIAKKISSYIEQNIIPENKWHDFEPFYSCTQLPSDFYDKNTKNHVINNLCIYWCSEGFKELYKITKTKHYLDLGEHILGILSLFQQVWNMPHLSYHTFGGFGVQNADAELNDARQALFVRTYMEYYLETGCVEYMERGIAALRASWALQLLSEYKDLCPGNLEGIETLDGIDRGCVCENYGHSGIDFRVPGYIMFDWGVGTASTATAHAKKHFGDLFIDFKHKKVFGIDGLLIQSINFNEKSVSIDFKLLKQKKAILIKARKAPNQEINLILNKEPIGSKNKNKLEKGFIFKI